MKVIKKISVFFLVCLLCFSSVFFSYEKANSCEAVSVAVFIGSVVLGVGALCYGAYYVSQPDNQEVIKESLTNYADMTVDNAKFCYETNKKVFNDFVVYATKNGGGSASVYTATGEKFSVDEMAEYGFPDFEDWDKQMRNQGSTLGASLWDKLNFGVDLLDFLCEFFEKEEYTGGIGQEQSYFHGDSDYINRETGNVFINYSSRAVLKNWIYSDGGYWNHEYVSYNADIIGKVDEKYKEDFRFALVAVGTGNPIPPILCGEYSDYPVAYNTVWICQKMGAKKLNMGIVYIKDRTENYRKVADGLVEEVDADDFYVSFRVNSDVHVSGHDLIQATNYKSYLYFSGNVPLFASYDEADYYIKTGDFSKALNLAPEVSPTPTVEPVVKKNTPVAVYCNYWGGRSVVPSDVVNTNYIIANDWDGTTENLTIILHDSDDEPTVTPGLTTKPIPTLVDDDGSNTTNNYIINITNILQPIQETVTNIYNFFVIDTEEVGSAINNINVLPTGKFDNFVSTFGNLSNIFSDNVQEECLEGQYGIKYPVVKVQCPKILLDFVPDNSSVVFWENGTCYLVLADCIKFAKYFVKVRAFLKACIWIGMIFYLMKELKPVITLSD